MMWDFYVPKELFFQLSVAFVLLFQVFGDKTKFKISRLDVLILSGLTLPGLISVCHGQVSIEALRIPFYTAFFYILVQSLSYVDRISFYNYVRQALSGFFVVGIMMAVYGLLQAFDLDFLHSQGVVAFGPKVIGTIGHANAFASYLAIVFPMGLAIYSPSQSRIYKYMILIGLLLIVATLLLTNSRGAWLALIISLFIFHYPRIKNMWIRVFKRRLLMISALMVLILPGILLFYLVFNMNPASVKGRFFVWRIARLMIKKNPLSGIGFQRFPVEYLNYQAKFFDNPLHSQFFYNAANMKQADNEYLQVFAENGFLGLLLSVLIIITLILYIRRLMMITDTDHHRLITSIGTALTVILIHSFVDNPLRNLPIMIIFLFSAGLLSMITKFEVNKRYTTIEFRHSFMLKGLILMFLCYNIFFVIIKGRAYIDWRRGYALVQSGKLPDGIALYEKAMKKLPETGELLFQLGSAYAYTHDSEKALPYLEQAKATFNDKNIYISEGLCYYRLRDFHNAQKSLSKTLRMYPNLLLPRLWLAEIYLQTGQEDDAVRLLHEIIEIQPKDYSKDTIIIKHDAKQLLSRIIE